MLLASVALVIAGQIIGFLLAIRLLGGVVDRVTRSIGESMAVVIHPPVQADDGEVARELAERLVASGLVTGGRAGGGGTGHVPFDPTDLAIPDFDQTRDLDARLEMLDRLPENQPGAPLPNEPMIYGLAGGPVQ